MNLVGLSRLRGLEEWRIARELLSGGLSFDVEEDSESVEFCCA